MSVADQTVSVPRTTPTVPLRRRARPGVYHALMAAAAFVWLVPVLWMLSMALTPNDALQREAVGLIPAGFTWSNFADVFRVGYMPRWFLNSFVVMAVVSAVQFRLVNRTA